MAHLYEALATRVDRWRAGGYPAPEHPAIAEVLEWATDPESGGSRFLQYTDIWANDSYLQFMHERLLLIAGLRAPAGALYLHCDSRKSHFLRCLIEEMVAEIARSTGTAALGR
jgi:hypothetical protein